jgi:hypothetical protein
MKTERSQNPATSTYPEPDKFSPQLTILFIQEKF